MDDPTEPEDYECSACGASTTFGAQSCPKCHEPLDWDEEAADYEPDMEAVTRAAFVPIERRLAGLALMIGSAGVAGYYVFVEQAIHRRTIVGLAFAAIFGFKLFLGKKRSDPL